MTTQAPWRHMARSNSMLEGKVVQASSIELLGEHHRGGMLTVYFGTPNMFITLWFGFDY
jgi:hypothetical protein